MLFPLTAATNKVSQPPQLRNENDLFQEANSLELEKKFPQAIATYKKLLQSQDTKRVAEAEFRLARIILENLGHGQMEEGLQQLSAAGTKGHPEALDYIGQLGGKGTLLYVAIEGLISEIKDPTIANEAKFRIGKILYENGNTWDGFELLESARINGHLKASGYLGLKYLNGDIPTEESYTDYLPYLYKAVKSDDCDVEVAFKSGELKLTGGICHIKDLPKAEEYFNKAIKLGGLEVAIQCGTLCMKKGANGLARKCFDQAVALGGATTATRIAQMISVQDSELAEAYLKMSVSSIPNHPAGKVSEPIQTISITTTAVTVVEPSGFVNPPQLIEVFEHSNLSLEAKAFFNPILETPAWRNAKSHSPIVIGDLDGSMGRAVLVGIKAGKAEIASKGMAALINLMNVEAATMKELNHDINTKTQRWSDDDPLICFQQSKENQLDIQTVANNLTYKQNERPLILIGDILFDRLTCDLDATAKICLGLQSSGAILIRGNHDLHYPKFLAYDKQFGSYAKQAANPETLAKAVNAFQNAHYLQGKIYTHHGLALNNEGNYVSFLGKVDYSGEDAAELVKAVNQQQLPELVDQKKFKACTDFRPNKAAVQAVSDKTKSVNVYGHNGIESFSDDNNAVALNPRKTDANTNQTIYGLSVVIMGE